MANIAEVRNTDYHGEHDERNHDHLEQIQEDFAENSGMRGETGENAADQRTGDNCYDNAVEQRETAVFVFVHNFSPLPIR